MKINICFLIGLMIGGMGTAYADDGLDTAMDQENESLDGINNESSSHQERCGFEPISCSENRSIGTWYQDMMQPLMRLEQALEKKAKSDPSAKKAKQNLRNFMVKMGDLLLINKDQPFHFKLERGLSDDERKDRLLKEFKRIHDRYALELPDVFGQIVELYSELPFSQFCSSDDIQKSVRFGNALNDMYAQTCDHVEDLKKQYPETLKKLQAKTSRGNKKKDVIDEGKTDHGAEKA